MIFKSPITSRCASVIQIVRPLESFCLQASAATITVDSTADPAEIGKTTLRDAITAANATAGADTIAFSVTGTILLESALPNLSDDVTISGPGANVLTVKRDPAAGGGIFTLGALMITNSTLTWPK